MIAWARTPGHDAYFLYRDAFFELVPVPGRATLEIGCGKGRVVRDLIARGHRVTGLDAAPSMVRAARLPIRKASMWLATPLGCRSRTGRLTLSSPTTRFMDVDDMPATVREAARVLEPGGRLCLCMLHPMTDAGQFTERTAEALSEINGSYLEDRVPWFRGTTIERDGLRITCRRDAGSGCPASSCFER